MENMVKTVLLSAILCVQLLVSCHSQERSTGVTASVTKVVGGPFENREFIYQKMPESIGPTDTSAGWQQNGPKLLLTGTVYAPNGITPVPGVVIYYYHTDITGRYTHRHEMPGSMPPNKKGQTHGYIRGWVKTNDKGQYFIYTVRPGTYPTRDEPAHVHLTVKEPNEISEYYIDDIVFDDDALLTTAKRLSLETRGGSGVVRIVKKDTLLVGERDIRLGLHIPDYPAPATTKSQSGREVGEEVFSFGPNHAWGPDKGTETCPVCKYGWFHGILYFVGNHPNEADILKWLIFLEAESMKREKYLKVFFVYGNEEDGAKNRSRSKLEKLGIDLQLKHLALTWVPSFNDKPSDIYLNKINPDVENTILVYKRRNIVGKFLNLRASQPAFELVQQSLDKSANEYFYLEGGH